MSAVAGLVRLALAAVVTGLVIAACAPRPEPDGEAEVPGGDDDGGGTQEARAAETALGDDARLRLEVEAAGPGQPVELALLVLNDASDELVLDFPDGQRFDFEILSGERSVWRWAADMFFTQMIGRERIEPGGSMRWAAAFEDGVQAGDYTVRGTLTKADGPVTVEVELTIE